MKPSSTVWMTDFSKVDANLATSGVLSSLALYSRPLVQAKIEAIGLVEVSCPF
jgi:hypothetical protein